MHRTSSVWRWQLIFTGSIVSVVVAVAALLPRVFTHPLFVAGIALVIVVTLVTFLIPWQRVRPGWIAVVPFADLIAIALTAAVTDLRIGFLWVIPVAWIATYYSGWVVAAAVATISVSLVAIAGAQGPIAEATMRVVVTMLALGFLGTSIRIGAVRGRAARRLLRRQSQQTRRAADRAAAHERRVTQIIDALDTALVAISARGVIVKMNEAYRELYGRDRHGARLPAPAVEYDDHRGEPLVPTATTLARAARGERLDGERVWLYDASGRWRALQVTTQPIASVDEDGETTLLIIDDITEQLEAGEERRKVAAIVSHELRNPLTAILGHVDLLLDRDDLPERVRRQLETVANASERMQRLVTSALESTRPTVRPERVDLSVLARAAVELFLPTAAAKNLTLTVVGMDALVVSGDAFRLRQALDNVLSNAVKYTPAGGRVSVRLGIADDDAAELLVSDTGVGIAPDDLGRLFEPYFRAPEAVRSGVPGTGLGLGIVREILTAHGGELCVTSERGVGTRVRMLLPRGPAVVNARALVAAGADATNAPSEESL
ncbi:sensor histidine kinase [Microbacterium sp. USHLN186]|uniref:sensor histidine kinase n=1 Tax=Microbacterium sp. USHLN186 TaxID=3081286 RepID=UPI00301A57E0